MHHFAGIQHEQVDRIESRHAQRLVSVGNLDDDPWASTAEQVVANLALAVWLPGTSWLWWNPAGFFAASLVALAASRTRFAPSAVEWPRRESMWLAGGFLVMLSALLALPRA